MFHWINSCSATSPSKQISLSYRQCCTRSTHTHMTCSHDLLYITISLSYSCTGSTHTHMTCCISPSVFHTVALAQLILTWPAVYHHQSFLQLHWINSYSHDLLYITIDICQSLYSNSTHNNIVSMVTVNNTHQSHRALSTRSTPACNYTILYLW